MLAVRPAGHAPAARRDAGVDALLDLVPLVVDDLGGELDRLLDVVEGDVDDHAGGDLAVLAADVAEVLVARRLADILRPFLEVWLRAGVVEDLARLVGGLVDPGEDAPAGNIGLGNAKHRRRASRVTIEGHLRRGRPPHRPRHLSGGSFGPGWSQDAVVVARRQEWRLKRRQNRAMAFNFAFARNPRPFSGDGDGWRPCRPRAAPATTSIRGASGYPPAASPPSGRRCPGRSGMTRDRPRHRCRSRPRPRPRPRDLGMLNTLSFGRKGAAEQSLAGLVGPVRQAWSTAAEWME